MPSSKFAGNMALVGHTSRHMPHRMHILLKYSSFTAPGGLKISFPDVAGISEASFKMHKVPVPVARSLMNCLRVIFNVHPQLKVLDVFFLNDYLVKIVGSYFQSRSSIYVFDTGYIERRNAHLFLQFL